jgi:hypothetical protein
MTVQQEDGTVLNKAALEALTTEVPQPSLFTVGERIYQTFDEPGAANIETGKKLLFYEGQQITQADIDALYTLGTVVSVTPATGAQAGGDDVEITGTGFEGSTGATIGGVAVTNFEVVDHEHITATTGAHAAGLVNVIVTDDDGNITGTGKFTYV